MPRKPILCPIVEIKIPQDPMDDSHVRRQTPEKLEAERLVWFLLESCSEEASLYCA